MKAKKMRILIMLVGLFLIPACNQSKENEPEDLLYNFSDSVKIIRSLIETKTVYKIFEEAKPEEIDFLLNNFSPAEIAFESEVLNCTMPVLIYFYEKEIKHRELLDALAAEYKDRIKIVLIDAMQFPKLAQQFEIEKYPAIVMMNQREETDRFSEADFGKISSAPILNS